MDQFIIVQFNLILKKLSLLTIHNDENLYGNRTILALSEWGKSLLFRQRRAAIIVI